MFLRCNPAMLSRMSSGSGERLEAFGREARADHGGMSEQLALEGGESIKAGCEHAPHRLGHVLRPRLLTGDRVEQGLREERIAARALGQRRRSVPVGTDAPFAERLDQLGRLVAGERLQLDGGCPWTGQGPLRPAPDLFLPGDTDLKQRCLRPLGEVVDQLEGAFVGPLRVLPHHNRQARP